MKTIILTLALALAGKIMVAQAEHKKTVRIKKIERINGVERITDTTYAIDSPEAEFIARRTGMSVLRDTTGGRNKMVIIQRTVTDNSATVPDVEQSGAEVISPRVTKAGIRSIENIMDIRLSGADSGMSVILDREGIDISEPHLRAGKIKIEAKLEESNGAEGFEGKTVMIKRLGKCDATNEEIDRAPVAYYVTIERRIRFAELSEADRKNLAGKPNAVHDGKLFPEEMKFYPNPGTGKFNLSFSLAGKGEAGIDIMDMQGKNVYSEKLVGFSGKYDKEIDISSQPKGVYFVRISQGDHAALKKIILE